MRLSVTLVFPALLANAAKVPNNIPAFSRLGGNIISKARVLEEFEYDNSWLGDYAIQYQGCSSVLQYGGREGGGGGDKEGETKLYMQNMVKFRLCPVNSCNKNCKGQYLVNMAEFLDSYTEFKMDAEELACENTRENCVCGDDVDDDVCENQCYIDAGLGYCIEGDDDAEEVEVQELLECEEMEIQNDNYNMYYYENGQKHMLQYFVGPRCSTDGKNIFIDVFSDGGCSTLAPSGTYEKYNYGASLPYKKESIVSDDCIACKEVEEEDDDDNNNNNNNNNNDEEEEVNLIELCEETYEMAGKCEDDLSIAYPRNNECKYINDILPLHEVNYKHRSAAGPFAFIFGLSSIGLGYMVYKQKTEGAVKKSPLSELDHTKSMDNIQATRVVGVMS